MLMPPAERLAAVTTTGALKKMTVEAQEKRFAAEFLAMIGGEGQDA